MEKVEVISMKATQRKWKSACKALRTVWVRTH